MIERQIVAQKLKEYAIKEQIFTYLGRLSCSHIKMQRTPLGERITVYTSKPGLIVGKKGANIKNLTQLLKTKFKLENPEIEVGEIKDPELDASTIAKNIVNSIVRFGPKRFKAIAYNVLDSTLKSGAKGIEVVISGRGLPGERAKSWRFTAGYLKKSGDIAENYIDKAMEAANLKSGTIGVKVSVLHPEIVLSDTIILKDNKADEVKIEEERIVEEVKEETKKEEKKKTTRKRVKKENEKE